MPKKGTIHSTADGKSVEVMTCNIRQRTITVSIDGADAETISYEEYKELTSPANAGEEKMGRPDKPELKAFRMLNKDTAQVTAIEYDQEQRDWIIYYRTGKGNNHATWTHLRKLANAHQITLNPNHA